MSSSLYEDTAWVSCPPPVLRLSSPTAVTVAPNTQHRHNQNGTASSCLRQENPAPTRTFSFFTFTFSFSFAFFTFTSSSYLAVRGQIRAHKLFFFFFSARAKVGWQCACFLRAARERQRSSPESPARLTIFSRDLQKLFHSKWSWGTSMTSHLCGQQVA
ncbi:hypothetical protein GN956_G7123 [Arapaima gigas]